MALVGSLPDLGGEGRPGRRAVEEGAFEAFQRRVVEMGEVERAQRRGELQVGRRAGQAGVDDAAQEVGLAAGEGEVMGRSRAGRQAEERQRAGKVEGPGEAVALTGDLGGERAEFVAA